jgi:cell division protein FtsL
MTESELNSRIERSSNPDFGDILSKSFELFKKTWEQTLYHALVTIAVVLPVILITYLPYILFMFYLSGTESANYYNEYNYLDQQDPAVVIPVLVVYFLVFFLVILLVQAVAYGITAHYLKVLKKVDTGSSEDTGGYFSCIKGNFIKLFVLSLATFGISILATLLCVVPLFYVMVPLQLVVVFFAFNPGLSVSKLIKLSFKLGNKFWLTVFGLIIIAGMIAQLGILLCFVGILFTAYFVHIPMYYVYKDTVGFETPEDKNLIETDL